MTPDLDTDPILLVGLALVLFAVAGWLAWSERRTPFVVVLLAQRREDSGPDDGVLDQQPEHDEQQGDDCAEDQRHGGVLRGEHPASVPALCRLGLHLCPRYVDAWAQAPAPVRCERCGRKYGRG